MIKIQIKGYTLAGHKYYVILSSWQPYYLYQDTCKLWIMAIFFLGIQERKRKQRLSFFFLFKEINGVYDSVNKRLGQTWRLKAHNYSAVLTFTPLFLYFCLTYSAVIFFDSKVFRHWTTRNRSFAACWLWSSISILCRCTSATQQRTISS